MLNYLFYLLFIIFYFLSIGYSTMLESKLLSVTQVSSGVFSFSFLNLYHFYLDFLKMLIKGLLKEVNFEYLTYLICLLMILFLNFVSFCFLPLNYFGMSFENSPLFYFMLDCSLVFFKILVLFLLDCKMVSVFCGSIKSIYVFLEGVCLSFYFLFLIFLVGVESHCCWSFTSLKTSQASMLFFLFLFLMVFVLVVIKLFSTPFDYFEIESELVGGGVVEYYGLGFVLWSLVEYGIIFNNSIFLSVLFSIFIFSEYAYKLFLFLFLFNFFYMFIFLFSGVFVSAKFSMIFYLVIKICLLVFLLFFGMVIFFYTF